MVVEREIPSQLTIRGFPCRVWYKGQPVRCNICRDVGHLAASCPNKGLCRRCKEPGHTVGQCSKAWNTAQTSVPTAAGPSSSGVPCQRPLPSRSVALLAKEPPMLARRILSRRLKSLLRRRWKPGRPPPVRIFQTTR